MEIIKERVGEVEDRSIEITYLNNKREKRLKIKNSGTCGTIKKGLALGPSESRKRKSIVQKNYLKKMMVENFLGLVKNKPTRLKKLIKP